MNELLKNIMLMFSSIIFMILVLEIVFSVIPLHNHYIHQKTVWAHWGNPDMPQWYNELYIYDDMLGYEKKDVYKEIQSISNKNETDYRILILGDSVSQWGKYVDYFEDMLTKRHNTSIKVVNAGVMGYDTELEYKYLKYRGLDLNPDLVIIQFSTNDFEGTPVIIKQKDDSWFAYERKKINKWINPILFKSKFYQFTTLRLMAYSERDRGKDNVKEPLTKIKNLLDERQIPFYLLIFPLFENSKYWEECHKNILQIVDELVVKPNTIDLTPYYTNRSFDEISIDPDHPNEEGDKIAASVLFERLVPILDAENQTIPSA